MPTRSKRRTAKSTPASLTMESDAYLPISLFPFRHLKPAAVTVGGSAMAPKMSEGDVVIVAVGLADQVKPGDVVLLALDYQFGDMIRTVGKMTSDTIELIPFNQEEHATITVERQRVAWMAPVVTVIRNYWQGRGWDMNIPATHAA